MCLRTALVAILAACPALGVPTIRRQPQPTSSQAGQTATFSVDATGNGLVRYQWRRDGFAIAGATASLFTLPSCSQGDSGSLDVVVTDADQSATSALAELRVTPRLAPELVVLDPARSLALENSLAAFIAGLAVQPDGRFFILGPMTSVEGRPVNGLARFLPNGTLDRTFSAPAFDSYVDRIALQPDGKIIVGGRFHYAGGVQSGGLARLNPDGSLDPTFAVGAGFSGAAGFGIAAIAIAPDGSVFVAGQFNSGFVGGGPAGPRLVKLTAQGTISLAGTPVHDAFDLPDSLAVTPEGKLIASGMGFRTAGQVPSADSHVVRFLPDGRRDSTFVAVRVTNALGSVSRLPDGKLLVAGAVAQTAPALARSGLVRLNEDGTIDPTFTAEIPAGNAVRRFDVAPDGAIFATLTGPSGLVAPSSLIKLTPAGAASSTFAAPAGLAASFVRALPAGGVVIAPRYTTEGGIDLPAASVLSPTGAVTATATQVRFPARVRFIHPLAGGKHLVTGDFTQVGGRPLAMAMRLNPDFTIDESFAFRPPAGAKFVSSTVQPDGRILISGRFEITTPFPQTASAVRLNADGTIERAFYANGGHEGISAPPSIFRDGRIFFPAQGPSPFLTIWNNDGTLASTAGFGTGPSGSLFGLAGSSRLPNGQILVGGDFTSWNGQPRANLVLLTADGAPDQGFAVSGNPLRPIRFFDRLGVGVQSTGRPVVGVDQDGVLTLQRVSAAGQVDATFNPPISPGSNLDGYQIQPDDKLLVWNKLSVPSIHPSISRLNANGTLDTSLTVVGRGGRLADINPAVTCAYVADSGEMLVAAEGELMVLRHATGPIIRSAPASGSFPSGLGHDFTVAASGSGSLTYQWLRDGTAIAGATGSTYRIAFLTPQSAGRYSVVVTDSRGSVTSAPAVLSVDTSANRTMRLSNVSVRARVSSQPMIVGFVVTGGAKPLLLRAVGPTLAQFNVANFLPNPRLFIYRDATLTAQNDNWGGAPAVAAAATGVGAFPLPPASLDAAMIGDFFGAQTVQIDGAGGAGVVLAEFYDPAPLSGAAPRIANISARHAVGSGDGILIAGFSIAGPGVKAVMIRGVGPGLEAFGVTGALQDPQLEVFSGSTRTAVNDNWPNTVSYFEAFAQTGAFPLAAGSKDAAIIFYLSPGTYTAQLSGVGGTTGEGLIEIYELP